MFSPRVSLASFSRTVASSAARCSSSCRPQRVVGRAEDAHREQSGVACLPDADRRHGDAVGHLHDRQQRVEPVELLQRHRHADHRQRRHRRGHARKVCGTAGAGDDHPQARGRRRSARSRTSRRACGAPTPRAPRAATPNSVSTSTAPCMTGQVGVAAHDHADERRSLVGHAAKLPAGFDAGASLRRGRTRTCSFTSPSNVDLRCPSELLARLGRVAHEQVDLGRAFEARRPVRTNSVQSSYPAHRRGDLEELPDGVGLTGGDDVVVGDRPAGASATWPRRSRRRSPSRARSRGCRA